MGALPPNPRKLFEKARQARIGHRGHVSKSTHSLEAGNRFPAHEKKFDKNFKI
ncbi:MAG: hypothetical protein FWF77_09975 [Defluviitaleaceae bacterium]|nr:hypothetical protein [Defluviitaleaceae bacterium]